MPTYPHEVTVDLGEEMTIKGLTVLPRQTGENGWISKYEVYLSVKADDWGDAVVAGELAASKDLKKVTFKAPVNCRYVRFVAVDGIEDQPWASMAELDVIPAD